MLKLDSNGRIAHLLVNYTNRPEKHSRDLCGVIRGLFIAFLTICFIIVVASAVTLGIFGWIVPLLAYGFTWWLLHEPVFMGSILLFGAVLLAFVLEFITRVVKRARWERRMREGGEVEKSPSLFAVWYDGFKNKYCPRVEFVDKSEDA